MLKFHIIIIKFSIFTNKNSQSDTFFPNLKNTIVQIDIKSFSVQKKIQIIYPILSLFILISRLFFLITTFLSIPILYLSSLIFSNFPILTFLFLIVVHQSFLIFFYLLVNHNTRISSSISPFLSHSILHLSTSIFFYLLANLVDAYLSLLQILNSLSISHYLSLQQKKISPLLRYFVFFFYKSDYILWPMK